MKPPAPTRMLPIAGAALVVASVAAGLLVLYPPFPPSPEGGRWRLDFHESLAGFADQGRLARCAWGVSGDVTASPEDAIAALAADQGATQEQRCGWYDMFQDHRYPDIRWRRVDASTIELCGEIKRSHDRPREMPLARHFTFREIGETPVQEGPHCYTIDVTAGVSDYYGPGPSGAPLPLPPAPPPP